MLKLALMHFAVVVLGYPLINGYLFFLMYGFILKQKPMGLVIEGVGFSPKGALLAATIGLLFCLALSIPCALIQILLALKVKSPILVRNILWITSLVYGLSLGISLSVNHFKDYYFILPIQCLFSGFLLAFLLSSIWK
jgi:hypothetical protein